MMTTTIFLLLIIFILLVISIVQVNRFKKYFGQYRKMDLALEREKTERMRDLHKEVQEQRSIMYQRSEEERERLRLEIEERRAKLDFDFERQRTESQEEYLKLQEKLTEDKKALLKEFELRASRIEEDKQIIQEALDEMKAKQENTINIMKEQEKEINELDFHRITFTSDEISDIELLLEVEKRLHNKDVLRKLIYKTYIERPMNEMFSRIGIKTEPGIYKIENINSKKVYIGQSTNVRNRLREHLKSAVGISTIANQAVHEAMAQEGIENFVFYLIDECDRDKLNDRERYWIDFYKSNEWGYNRTRGGS